MSSLRQFASATFGGLIGVNLLLALAASIGWLCAEFDVMAKHGGS